MSIHRAETSRVLHNFSRYLLSDVRSESGKVNPYLSSTYGNKLGLYRFFISLGDSISALWRMMTMPHAPLRRIVTRDLCVDHPDPRTQYSIFSLNDTLECGHVENHYLFGGLADLTNPYTESSVVKSKRHRCKPCASLLAKKRPQSVPLMAAAKTA